MTYRIIANEKFTTLQFKHNDVINVYEINNKEMILTYRKILTALVMLGVLAGQAEAHTRHKAHKGHRAKTTTHVSEGWSQNGVASYYGPGFWGRKTAMGNRMKRSDMTAAHKSLPLGTKLLVTNKETGKSVTVTVNDRGPYTGHRIIDLAEKPAQAIGLKGSGTAAVSIVALSIPAGPPVEVAEYVPRTSRKHR